ncbi:putative Colanic acid exporter [Shewanella benthica]|uniref:Putative Colanic acid exporter n=1 Tax=Shewanella benthica TaxID=43661 RepID=A0A330M5W1_9GAMM|nr:lipopolysaccharide biosynthesis protein [Shewanella benthica]SQH77492.1 putative Colanic acid exporter [Shewanella benthica]
MKENVKKGLNWSGVSVLVKAIVLFVQMVVLARVLPSEELGQVVVLNIIIGLVYLLSDMGMSSAVIYNKTLTESQLSQIQTINILLGVTLTIFVVILSGLISSFYDVNSLEFLIKTVAPVFFIRSVGLQSYALCQRDLDFKSVAKIEILSSVVGFVILLICLFFSLQVYSVVFSILVSSFVFTVLSIFYCKLKFAISAVIKLSEIRKPLSYGIYQSADNLMNYISSQFDSIVIGKLLGMETLGVYSYLKELLFKPSLQVVNLVFNRMLFPVLSSFQNDNLKGKVYLQASKSISIANITMYSIMFLFGSEILHFFYGIEWVDYLDIFRIMIPYVLFVSLVNPVGSLLKSTGQVKRSFLWNLIFSALRVLVILLSVKFGLKTLLVSLGIFMFCCFLLHWYFLLKPTGNIKFILWVYSYKEALVSVLFIGVVYYLSINVFKYFDFDLYHPFFFLLITGLFIGPLFLNTVRQIGDEE